MNMKLLQGPRVDNFKGFGLEIQGCETMVMDCGISPDEYRQPDHVRPAHAGSQHPVPWRTKSF